MSMLIFPGLDIDHQQLPLMVCLDLRADLPIVDLWTAADDLIGRIA